MVNEMPRYSETCKCFKCPKQGPDVGRGDFFLDD